MTALATPLLDEALGPWREVGSREVLVLTTARRALLPGGEPGAALAAIAEYGDRVSHRALAESRFLLCQATGDRAHLFAEAKRMLDLAVGHSPDDCRESMLAKSRRRRGRQGCDAGPAA